MGVASSGTLSGDSSFHRLPTFLIEQLGWRRAYAVLGTSADSYLLRLFS